MRDRFPLLILSGLLLAGFTASFLVRGAKRGGFADVLSTYRSEPDGARALFALADENGVQVERLRTDLNILDGKGAIALLGVEMGTGLAKEKIHALFKLDGGADEDDDDFRKGFAALNTERVSKDEREKLLAHVKAGNTLVYVPYGAASDDSLLDALHVRVWRADGAPGLRTLVPAQPSPYTAGVEHLETKVKAFFGLPDEGVPLLIDQQTFNIAAGVVEYGQGQIVILGAPELAMNTALARADNAQLWLSLLRTAGGRGAVTFDEFHHGFSDDRSIAEFARRYGLHFAAAQLLLGLCLWTGSLRRFGRPRKPPEDERVGATDALFAQSRLYREGKHQAFAAKMITSGLTQELAHVAGESARSEAPKVIESLRARGRADLAAALMDVKARSDDVKTEGDLQRVAELAARARQLVKRSRT